MNPALTLNGRNTQATKTTKLRTHAIAIPITPNSGALIIAIVVLKCPSAQGFLE